ncbi:MAG: FAD-dependent monooxygenase [Pseudomonadota bacterium]|nr:FAD-dependent monooxygenase [Pseudomonadota bacterium]
MIKCSEFVIESGESQAVEVLSARQIIVTGDAGSGVRKCLELEFKGSTYLETTVLASTMFPFHGYIDELSNINYRMHQRIIDTYRVERVVLASDSAHINSLQGGMGMNGDIHDVFSLVEKLSIVWRGGDDALLDK